MIPAIHSQMLPDLAMARGAAIALPIVRSIVRDVKAGNDITLPATRAPCKHHGNAPCCITYHLAKGRHKRVRAFDCLM
jgi:pyrimidine deaminase RibD-like protein